jgi:cytochrome o ubiquinol oxidase subunit IV
MSDTNLERNLDDVAPGFADAADASIRQGIQGYLLGFVFSVVLTAMSFYAVHTNLIWGPGIPMTLVVLAVAQIGVHLVFFLHITTAPDNTNNVLALAFGVLIVLLIMGGSLWIMHVLNERMMPMPTMQMHQSLPQ